MIAASIVGVVVAAVLLIVGLLQQSTALYYSSIAASVLAAFALLIGVRRLPSAQLPEDDFDLGRIDRSVRRPRPAGRAAVPRQTSYPDGPDAGVGGPGSDPGRPEALDGLSDAPPPDDELTVDPDSAPPDEPEPQSVSPEQAEAVGRLGVDVCVIDGRARYHLTDCLHLLGREVQRLPVMEAVELGFTPCGLCRPVSVLLSDPATG